MGPALIPIMLNYLSSVIICLSLYVALYLSNFIKDVL